MSSEVEALKVAFSSNTNSAEWAAWAVFVGLLGDIAVILVFDLFDKDKSWWEIILAGIASAVIAGGVWGESHFGHRATDASSRIQAILEKQAADANERAAKAEAHAKEADAQAGEANKKAAELEFKAEKLKADNLKLEREMFGLRGQGDDL